MSMSPKAHIREAEKLAEASGKDVISGSIRPDRARACAQLAMVHIALAGFKQNNPELDYDRP